MNSHEAHPGRRGLEGRGQVKHHKEHWEAQIDHSWGLEVNVEGIYGH